jgi:hypothetical protein
MLLVLEELGDFFKGCSGFNICVHQGCVARKQQGIWRKSHFVQDVFEHKRIAKIGRLGLLDGCKHLCHPFAKAMGEAANVSTDWSGGPMSIFLPLVYFVQHIELAKGTRFITFEVGGDILVGLVANSTLWCFSQSEISAWITFASAKASSSDSC